LIRIVIDFIRSAEYFYPVYVPAKDDTVNTSIKFRLIGITEQAFIEAKTFICGLVVRTALLTHQPCRWV